MNGWQQTQSRITSLHLCLVSFVQPPSALTQICTRSAWSSTVCSLPNPSELHKPRLCLMGSDISHTVQPSQAMFTPILPKGKRGFTRLHTPQHGQTREQLSATEAASPDRGLSCPPHRDARCRRVGVFRVRLRHFLKAEGCRQP